MLTLMAMALVPLRAAPQTTRPPVKKTTAAVRKTSTKPTTTAHPVVAHSAVRGHSAYASSVGRTTRTRSGRPVRATKASAAPTYQLHPDPDRYIAIQKALADSGYFKGEPNGQWGDDSVDAMRRFQADQKIDNDGKIDALSLIGLGLGPRHDGTTATEPQPLAPVAPVSNNLLPAPQPAASSLPASVGQPQ